MASATMGWTASVFAQTQPPASTPVPDDTPSIRVGAVLYGDYSYTKSPETRDADGNTINPSAFNVTRSYIDITGNVSHIVAFRFTPDIARETGAGSSLAGSLVFRVKYAYAQFNLDDWITQGSWARLGVQQTPWVDFEEGIYRYRFQGTVFTEREGYLSSNNSWCGVLVSASGQCVSRCFSTTTARRLTIFSQPNQDSSASPCMGS